MRAKLFFVIAFTFFMQIVNAQNFGFKGGVNLANVTIAMNGATVSPKSVTGFHFGPVVDFTLKENFHFNTGLLYSQKGFSGDIESTHLTAKSSYLEIPLNLAYKIPIKDKSDFFIQAGPYLGYGINVKETTGGQSMSGSFKEAGLKSLDYGLGFGGGVEFGVIVASFNYQLGLANIDDGSAGVDAKMKNKVMQISIAWMYGKKK